MKKLNLSKNVLYPAILGVLFVIFTMVTWGKWGNPIFDTFREALLPTEFLKGEVPYRDFLCLYPPLGYQINAILYKIFGVSLNVLYFAGIISSIFILGGMYFVTKKFTNDKIAFIATFLTMCYQVFRVSGTEFTSWFFPYSYSALYAFVAVFGAFLCLINFEFSEDKKVGFLYGAAFLFGLSVTFKPEYTPFGLLIIFIVAKNYSLKNLLLSAFSAILPIGLSMGQMFMTGFRASDFKIVQDFYANFQNSASVAEFNATSYPSLTEFLNSKVLLDHSFTSIKLFLVTFAICFVFGAIISFLSKENENNKVVMVKKFFITVTVFAFAITAIVLTIVDCYNFSLGIILNIVVAIGLVSILIKMLKNPVTETERAFVFIAISGFLLIGRSLFFPINSSGYNFTMTLFVIATMLLLFEILPKNITNTKKTEFLFQSVQLSIILFSINVIFCWIFFSISTNVSFSGERGKFFVHEKICSNVMFEAVKYIENNLSKDAKLLLLPEGEIVNFYSKHDLCPKYYSLIPHIIDGYGEDNIVKNLFSEKYLPDCIMIYGKDYNGKLFGLHYGQKIFKEIQNRYEIVGEIFDKSNSDFAKIYIYKLK